MAGWENFLIAELGASAALTGLLFVGVSINLSRILTLGGVANRAFEALLVLGGILIVASLLLAPDQSLSANGLEMVVTGIVLWAGVTIIDVRTFRETAREFRYVALRTMALSQPATLSYVIGGIILIAGNPGGAYFLVPAVIFSFAKAILDAWVLLIEINR